MLEYIIVDNLLHHFFTFNLISDNQFGFLPGHSSCSQLLCAINKWFLCYDSGDITNIVYTDIAKAFESVCHSKLISVFSSLGISSKVLKWINSFLKGVFSVCGLITVFHPFCLYTVEFLKVVFQRGVSIYGIVWNSIA